MKKMKYLGNTYLYCVDVFTSLYVCVQFHVINSDIYAHETEDERRKVLKGNNKQQIKTI